MSFETKKAHPQKCTDATGVKIDSDTLCDIVITTGVVSRIGVALE